MFRFFCAIFVVVCVLHSSASLELPQDASLSVGKDRFWIDTLVAATVTAMYETGEVNLDLIATQAKQLSASGVSMVFVCGTTGESLSLTIPERQAIVERWVEVLSSPEGQALNLTLIVHVGTDNVESARQLAVHAASLSPTVAAVAAMPPSFFLPATVQVLVSTMQAIASAAPDLPFYYYHIPSMTNVNFAMHDFLSAAHGVITNLNGIKYTDYNLMDFAECVAFENHHYNMLSGRDEILLAALSMGADGAVGSTYNLDYMIPIYHRVMDQFHAGDMASALQAQQRAVTLVQLLQDYNQYGGANKALVNMTGLACGPPRLPQLPLSQTQYAALQKQLQLRGYLPL